MNSLSGASIAPVRGRLHFRTRRFHVAEVKVSPLFQKIVPLPVPFFAGSYPRHHQVVYDASPLRSEVQIKA